MQPAVTLLTLLGGHGRSVPVHLRADGALEFIADADIDADGSPHAYHPDDRSGLDALANARDLRHNFVGVVTGPRGTPITQNATDPAPGFYVSATTYQWPAFHRYNPLRYVDSELVPFAVVSPRLRTVVDGIVLGCRCLITHTRTGLRVEAVVADIGPRTKIGELSIAAAKAIGVPHSARNGGEEDNVIRYEIFPGTPAVVNGVTYPLIGVNAA